MKYIIKGACKSVIGKVRENNEDNYYFNFKTLKEDNDGSNKIATMQFENIDNVICSVFDGMGGETKGERASFLASSTLKEYIQKNTNKEFEWEKYIKAANEKICNEMTANARMGTTMAAVQFSSDKIKTCNLGDSRIYGLQNKKLSQISLDHTDEKLYTMLNAGANHKPRLTQHLGIKEEEMILTPYKKSFSYEQYEKILICSDGLTDMLEDKQIEKIMSKTEDVKEIVEELIDVALEKGGIDNTTVIVFEIKKEKKVNYKKIVPLAVFILAIIIGLIMIIQSNNFKITKNEYSGAIVVGQSYMLEFKGNVQIEISNDNIEYKDGKVTALKEGNTTITITDKKGNTLYKQTIKIFPK